MAKIKSILASLLCGVSAISLLPNTDYSQYVPQNTRAITTAAWQKTGKSLKKSITKVGTQIGAIKANETR